MIIIIYFSAVLILHTVLFTTESVVALLRNALTTKTKRTRSLILNHTVPSVNVRVRSHFLDVHFKCVSKNSLFSPCLSLFALVLVLNEQTDPRLGQASYFLKHPIEEKTLVT